MDGKIEKQRDAAETQQRGNMTNYLPKKRNIYETRAAAAASPQTQF